MGSQITTGVFCNALQVRVMFHQNRRNPHAPAEYLWGLQKRFQEYPLVVEIRHASWMTEAILDTFAALGLGLCNIDQPLFHRSVKRLGTEGAAAKAGQPAGLRHTQHQLLAT